MKALAVLSLLLCFTNPAAATTPVMAFDLGQTLVEHSEFVAEDQAYRELSYAPGALDYLRNLKALGLPVILVANVPDSWGGAADLPLAQRQQNKMEFLKHSVRLSWERTPANPPDSGFDWSLIGDIVLPLSAKDRKKTGDLSIYLRTRRLALEKYKSGKVIYQGEDPREMCEAYRAGLLPRRVRPNQADFLLPLEKLASFPDTDDLSADPCKNFK